MDYFTFSKRLEMIPGFAETLFAVLNGFCGTIADAGHAVGAVAAPDRLAVLDRAVVRGAAFGALAAAGAGVTGRKRLCLDKARVEDRIHRAAHEAVIEIVAGRCELLPRLDSRDGSVNVRLRPGNDLPCFLRLRCVEHGDVIFGHDNLRRAHIDKLFLLTERAVILSGITDLTAAGHDEPCLCPTGEVRSCQPILHNARDAPCVSGRDDHQALIGCDRRSITSFDAVIHAEKLVAQGNRNALCDVPAVPSTGEIEYHT